MKNNKNKFFLMILIIISLFFLKSQKVLAENNTSEYTIDAYDINIIVNEDNTYKIIETIQTSFYVPKHGIYRKIPLRNKVTRPDGTISNNNAKIKDLEVDNQYSISTAITLNGVYQTIKIGNKNIAMTGKKKYRLSYVYNIGNDSSKEYDEFYYNLIGYEWDTTISNISFNIKMPKEFDTSKIEFYSGEVDSTSSSNITYSTDGKSVYGTFNGTLNPGNALTIRIEMPEGYYVKQKVDIDNIKSNAISMLSIIFAFISFILWVKYGKDEKVTKEIQFFPPEGLNSLEVALFYKGKVNNNDVISLLIYLANKGYVKLVEPIDDKDLKIISQKEYDGNNQNEALFLDGLFKDKYGNKITTANKKTLINNFYKTIKKIKKDMNSKYYAEKIYEKSSLNCKKIVLLMISVLSIIIFISRIEISPILFMFILTSCILYTPAFKSPKSIKSIIVIIFVLQFTLPPLISYFLFLFLDLNYLIAIICLIIMITFYFIMPKRNAYGKEMFRKILSFKEFLETCGDLQLEVLLKSYPNYLNDMLAYSYAFGFSNEWVKYFNTFSLTEPKWYIGRKPRNSLNSFTNIFNTTLNSTTKSMSSNPLSGGGGSSGRGSSGGGSGGGGGGSW